MPPSSGTPPASTRRARTDPALALRAAHHLLLAHGLGTQALRAVLPATAQVSITLNLSAVLPAATSPAATNAVRRIDGLANRLFLDPLFRGHYPADVQRDTARLTDWSFVRHADLALIAAPIDLLGINYYTPTLVDVGGPPTGPVAVAGVRERPRSCGTPGPATAMGWAIDAQGLRNVVHRVHDQYRPIPLMITENGAAFDDQLGADGVRDDERIAYLRDHLDVVHEAIDAGVDLRGYFVWSLLDNFEWAYGYAKRFGIVHVDYATQARVWKDSAHWYRQVIQTNGID